MSEFQTKLVLGQRHASPGHVGHEYGPRELVQQDVYLTQPTGPNMKVGAIGINEPQTLLTDFGAVKNAGWQQPWEVKPDESIFKPLYVPPDNSWWK